MGIVETDIGKRGFYGRGERAQSQLSDVNGGDCKVIEESQSDMAKLNPPKVPRVRYVRNVIKTAVCEVKFPIVLDLESKPPTQLQKRLKRSYPFYEVRREISLGPNPGSN